MKRDMELVRELLIAIEETPPNGDPDVNLTGYGQQEIQYHLLILSEAGLIDALDVSSSDGIQVIPSRLTWAGHEFLDAARNDAVWKKTWGLVVSRGGSVAFEVLKDLLIQVSKQYFLGTP